MSWLLWLLLIPLAFLLGLPVLGMLYQALGEWLDNRRFPPPGRRVKVDGIWLHYTDSSPASPSASQAFPRHATSSVDDGPLTVVLEAGISASSLSWAKVLPALAPRVRTIAYDRGGLAWSGPTDVARLADRLVFELEGLLDAAHVNGPLILVGHSFGGLLCLMYAVKHRHRVAGVVLVDPVTRCEWAPLRPAQAGRLGYGVHMALRGALLSKLGVVRFVLFLLVNGSRAFPQAVSRATSGRASIAVERLVGEVRKLPPETWPMIRAHWSLPKTFLSMASHLKNLPESIQQYDPEAFPPQVPLTILTAESANPYAVAEHHADAQRSLVGEHRVVPDSGHWIHLDQPEVVAEQVLRMVRFVESLKLPA